MQLREAKIYDKDKLFKPRIDSANFEKVKKNLKKSTKTGVLNDRDHTSSPLLNKLFKPKLKSLKSSPLGSRN